VVAIPRMRRTEVFPDDAYPLHGDRRLLEGPVVPHAHDFCELAVVLSGRAAYRTRHGHRRLGAGDVVAVRPGSWHEYRDVAGLDVVNVYLGPELLSGDLAWVLEYPALANLFFGTGDVRLRLSQSATDRVRGWLAQLADCREADRRDHAGVARPLQLRSLLGCALAEIAGAEIAGGRSPGGPVSPAGPIAPATRAALLAMARDPARDWSAADLAAAARVSSSHLQHQFAAQLGVSPLGWLAQYRAEQMAVRLAATTRPVAEIGRAVGWADPNYAARKFRAAYGMSPTSYRRRFAFGDQ
jgi:AraC-like DNA-binding protein/mannose-6-phosphate isomerase-like protein (cupin superfamily)